MANKQKIPEGQQELIRWRWSNRPTIKSLATEYGVSTSCIADILEPKLRNRRKKKYAESKKLEKEGPTSSDLQHTYSARKASRRRA